MSWQWNFNSSTFCRYAKVLCSRSEVWVFLVCPCSFSDLSLFLLLLGLGGVFSIFWSWKATGCSCSARKKKRKKEISVQPRLCALLECRCQWFCCQWFYLSTRAVSCVNTLTSQHYVMTFITAQCILVRSWFYSRTCETAKKCYEERKSCLSILLAWRDEHKLHRDTLQFLCHVKLRWRSVTIHVGHCFDLTRSRSRSSTG